MKKYILVLILLLQIINLTKAQVPGYQGKRLILEGTANLGLFSGFVYLSSSGEVEDINFIVPQISLDYAIARKQSLGLVYNFHHSLFDIWVDNGSTFTPIKHDITTHDIRLKYTWYHNTWSLAPVGSYRYISAGYMFASPKISQKIPFTTDKIDLSNFSFQFGFGNRYMLNNHLTLNYGIELGILTSIFNYSKDPGSIINKITYEQGLKNIYFKNTLSNCFFRINVGLGGLF